MKSMFDAMSKSWREQRASYHLTLGGLIKALKSADGKKRVCTDQKRSLCDPHSYRGYYEDLAFEESGEDRSVSEVLKDCEGVIGETLQGYKGGNFVMEESTPLWVSHYGQASDVAIVGVNEVDDAVVLITKKVED